MAALAFVGSARNNLTTGGTTIATTARSFTTGNHVVAFVRWEGAGGATTVTLADTAGNTYTALADVSGANGLYGKMFHCIGITGNASNVVTATFAASRTYRSLTVIEISGDTPTVNYGSTSGSATRLTLSAGIDFGDDSFIVAGGGNFAGDAGSTFTDRSDGTWSAVTPAFNWAAVSYSQRPTGKKGLLIDFNGTSDTSRVMAVIALNSGVNVPADYTTGARLSQVASEVLMTNTNPGARVSQMAVEVLRPNSGPPGPSTVPPLIFTAG
jgi:hypothetical protein